MSAAQAPALGEESIEASQVGARDERALLLAYIRAARSALADLAPNLMRVEHLPSAMNEIGMIVETTETAANQIIDAVDLILGLPRDLSHEAYRSSVEEKCSTLIEACAFQDLTGQRSTKVIETLLHIEDKLGKLAALIGDDETPQTPPEQRAGDDVLLNGPAMPGEGVDQDEIDAMFA
jgi:chemotaxis protein CheZ